MNIDQLESERLVLEPLVPDHAEKLYALISDPRLYEFMDDEPPASVGALKERYRLWSARRSPDGSEIWLNWAARLRGTDEYVGWFQATIRGDAAQLGYAVFVPYQLHGYAREACAAVIGHLTSAYDVRHLWVTVDLPNNASIQLAKSLGFVERENDSHEIKLSLDTIRHPGAHIRDSSE